LQYETALRTGKFVVIAHGTAEEAADARAIVHRTNPDALEEHQLSLTTSEAWVAGR
jgi:hypothetical protein